MAPRLKVFVTSDGLTDYVVAATSRAKALAAWGVHQDLFKAGRATETDDPALAEAARAQPETVLRRPRGVEAARLAKAAPRRRKAPTAAERRRLADAERRLADLDAARRQELDSFEARREALAREAAAAEADFEAARSRLQRAVETARRNVKGR